MLEELKKLLEKSYCPISNKQVAAIIKMKDSTTFSGVNIENPSFKSGLCAEQVAIGKAITAGYKRGDFAEIYIMDNSGDFINPCFLCRQNFVEFFTDTKIILMNTKGEKQEYDLNEMCPHAFRLESSYE